MSRPDTITVCTRKPPYGAIVGTGRANLRDLAVVSMNRHPHDEDAYGCSGSISTRSLMAMKGLADFLDNNQVAADVTWDKHDGINYIRRIEVKGKKEVDKLVALAEVNVGEERPKGKTEDSGPRF